MDHRREFRVVQPWGRKVAEESTLISVHLSEAEAFRAIDAMAAQMARTGVPTDAITLAVVDPDGIVLRRPES